MYWNNGFLNKTGAQIIEARPFVIEVSVSELGTYTLGLQGDNDLSIDWGDGTREYTTQDRPTHQYSKAGIYTITCHGNSSQINFAKQTEEMWIKQWGSIKWKKLDGAFFKCLGLNNIYTADAPDLSAVSDLSFMFAGTRIGVGGLARWDVSNITNITSMFSSSYISEDISNWNVSRVTEMGTLFYNNYWFNRDISTWDVSNVKSMRLMFFNARIFNQDLSTWNISNVSNMCKMLAGSKVTADKYDKLLITWEQLARENPNCNFANPDIDKEFRISTTYCSGETARRNLIQNHGFSSLVLDYGKQCP